MTNKKIVYITGCLGFIGSHVTQKCLDLGWYVIGVDKMTYASNPDFLATFERFDNFKFIAADINHLDRLHDCDYVINCCAETHVDNSIESSEVFVQSNINGVHHLLQLIRSKGSKMPTLIQFSTDEVYGDIVEGFHKEDDILKPSNPYSATKASADMLVLAWARTYNLPYVIVRPTNNYGIGQYVEKLIPKTIKYLTIGRKIELHDGGEPRRTWLHADDTANAIITIINAGVVNEIYNISGNYETSNKDVVEQILKHFDQDLTVYDVTVECSRQGQDVRYAIDDSKLKELGWTPKAVFADELYHIVEYYKDNFVW